RRRAPAPRRPARRPIEPGSPPAVRCGGFERKVEPEARPAVERIEADAALVGLDDAPRHGQPEPGAGDAGRRRVAAVERLEELAAMLGWDPGPFVGDPHARVALILGRADRDRPAFG